MDAGERTPVEPESGGGPRRGRWLWPAVGVAAVAAIVAGLVAIATQGAEETEPQQQAAPPQTAPAETAPPAAPLAWRAPSGLVEAAGGASRSDPPDDYVAAAAGREPGAPHPDVDIVAVTAGTLELDAEQAAELFSPAAYPCGQGWVVCDRPMRPMPAGKVAIVSVAHGAPPASVPGTTYSYALAIDTDGDAGNDFGADAPAGWELFRGTDRVFQVQHVDDRWRLEATEWDASARKPVRRETSARVILDDVTLVWVVPLEELGQQPAWRVTAFRHHGTVDASRSAGDVSGADAGTPPTPLG